MELTNLHNLRIFYRIDLVQHTKYFRDYIFPIWLGNIVPIISISRPVFPTRERPGGNLQIFENRLFGKAPFEHISRPSTGYVFINEKDTVRFLYRLADQTIEIERHQRLHVYYLHRNP